MLADQRPRLAAGRDPGEQRPGLRLPEDRPVAQLIVAGIAARVPAPPGPLTAQGRPVLRRGGPQPSREALGASEIGQRGEARIDVGELRRDERRLGHAENGGREIRPVAVGAGGQVTAVWAPQALLVGEGAHQVLPEGGGAAVAPAQLLVEERRVAARQPVFRRGPEQPQVEVVRGPLREGPAHLPHRVGDLAAGAVLLLRRVAENLPRQAGVRVDQRQDVLKRVAEGRLPAELVLVIAALGDDVVATGLLEGGARAEHVAVPGQLPREPAVAPREGRLRHPARPGALAAGEGCVDSAPA